MGLLHNEGPTRCPKCNASSPCVHYESVHNGIGYEYFDHIWSCPEHGDFAPRARYRFRCDEHEDCRSCPELAEACERSKPAWIFQEDEAAAEAAQHASDMADFMEQRS